MELESFELVLLRRPSDAPAYDEETIQRIQREHLSYLASLRASGDIATNGPVMDQPDESLRGLAFYRTGSLARARELAEMLEYLGFGLRVHGRRRLVQHQDVRAGAHEGA